MARYKTADDGEWFAVGDGARVACCHCGLVHNVAARTRGRRIELQFTQNPRSTALTRRQSRYEFRRR